MTPPPAPEPLLEKIRLLEERLQHLETRFQMEYPEIPGTSWPVPWPPSSQTHKSPASPDWNPTKPS
ncbi:MAG: hypothetical protein HC904_17485, partial [Blastochloris sp.]|nr:hypothetical protein [Blastochloris sp.]